MLTRRWNCESGGKYPWKLCELSSKIGSGHLAKIAVGAVWMLRRSTFGILNWECCDATSDDVASQNDTKKSVMSRIGKDRNNDRGEAEVISNV